MKIAFHSNQLGLRGTEVALYDYAYFNQELLGHESVIFCNGANEIHPAVREKFEARFECVFYERFTDLERIASRRGIGHTYFIKAGSRDGLTLASTRNLVHAVFPTDEPDWHGDRFAFISDWLAAECSNARVPFVPHIVSLPRSGADLREELIIPAGAMVYGCHGGRDSFDIPFVRDVVAQADALLPHLYFVFLNIAPFCSHPRVRFLPGCSSMERKVAFINTCDAMLHARALGESFGLACAEFSISNKPVLTFADSPQRCHLGILGDAAFRYRDRAGLLEILRGLSRADCAARSWDRYSKDYAPGPVMEKFRSVFLSEDWQRPYLRPQDKAWLKLRRLGHRVGRAVRKRL